MNEIAAKIETAIRFAKERTATQIRRVLQETAAMPAGVLADYLEEHYPHLLHDDSAPGLIGHDGKQQPGYGISTLEVLRHPESDRTNTTVQRHPKTGKIVAFRGPDSKTLMKRFRQRRQRSLHGDVVHAVNGPGGAYAVFVEPGYWGSGERTAVYPVNTDSLLTTRGWISQRTRSHEEAITDARQIAENAAFPSDRYTQEGYV